MTMVPGRLFGTDGVRGVAGRYPLDPATVRRLGAALVRALPSGVSRRLLVGRDTRESGVWIQDELARGAAGEGATVTSAGIVPTPAVAFLARHGGHDLGVVISASHNPWEDNGIKVFSGQGHKFTDRIEREVEAIVADPSWEPQAGDAPRIAEQDLSFPYVEHLRGVIGSANGLGGMKIAVDCANGAMTGIAPALFRSLGLEVVSIGDRPDGRNINLGCGSTHPEQLAATVVAAGCRLGVAFDGDGDRAIFVDAQGAVVGGDAVLLMCARQLKREERLKGDAIVATVMSNIGLELALARHGISIVRCSVGDKHVMEEIIARGLSLGGEQSGHVIFIDYLFTGDGLCTALNVIRTMMASGRSLRDLASELVSYPQVLLNVRVREKVDLGTIPPVAEAIRQVEAQMDGDGRLLVRYSGTEPLLRVMIEGRDEHQSHRWAQDIVDAVAQHLA